MFLLDTNIISDVAHNPGGVVGRRISEIDPELMASSVIVAGEIWYGVENNPSFRSRSRTESFMETLRILPLQPEVGKIYGSIRAHLRRTGGELSANDLLIAAHALSLDATLVTGDDRAFSRVPGLKIENWLRP